MKYISLFSGIGGFEYGIQQSKYADKLECIGYSEVDKYAEDVYRYHFPNHTRLGDVTKIRTEELPEFDFLVGGFPCQSFSVAGKRGGFNDTRGTLFFEIARILKDKKPKYFLLENVKNLISHDKGRTFKTILKILSDMGYNVQWQVLNSKDFGVPQNRERIFIKGYSRKRRECASKVLSVRGINEKDINLTKLNYGKGQGQTIYDINGVGCTITGCGGGQGGKTGLYLVPTTKENNFFAVPTKCRDMPLHKKRDNYVIKPVITPNRINKKQNGRRIKEDNEPMFTLTSNDVHGVTDGYKVRRLMPVEYERLQGFPDDYTKKGVTMEISDTQRYKMCGNAVTTNVVTYIINNFNFLEDDLK